MKATRVGHVGDLWGEVGVNGGYCRVNRDGVPTWIVRTPNGHVGDLTKHDVTEHDDGSITVSPSILVSDDTGELYHGYRVAGEWTP